MRIAFFCTRFPTVSETFVLGQLAGLLDAGHEIDIHAIQPGEDSVLQPIFKRYRLDERISYRGRRGSVAGRILATLALLVSTGLSSPIKTWRLRQILKSVPEITFAAALFTLKGLRERPRADLIYAHFGPNGQIAAVLKAAGFIDRPIITVFHGFDVTLVIHDWGRDYYRVLFEHGDLMLPVSREFQRRLESFGCAASRIKVHHMGVDTRALPFLERDPPRSGEPIVVLSIARLVEKKGICDGIQAVSELSLEGLHIRYDILGDGVLRPQLEQQIKELEAENVVRILGWKSQEEVAQHMKQAHIYLAPSVTASTGDEEGIPVVLMEAAATGLPLVSTRHSGIPELVREGETGLLAEEHDVEGLKNALRRLAADDALRCELGRRGHEVVGEEFDQDKLNSRLLKLLEEHARP